MKTKSFLILLTFFSVLLTGCFSSKEQLPQNSTGTLAEADIYKSDLVVDAIKQANKKQEASARKKFMKAVDYYRNKKMVKESIPLFKASICQVPTAKAYYELGNALSEVKAFDESLDAYRIAIDLKYNPIANVYYNIACVYAQQKDEYAAFEYLEEAVENGYSNKIQLTTDKDLVAIRKTEKFQIFLVKNFSKTEEERKKNLFDMYLAGFEYATLPFTIDNKTIDKFDDSKYISYGYEPFIKDMEDGEFSRDVSNEYAFVAKLNQSESQVLVVYETRLAIADTLQPTSFMLALYDNNGLLLDEMELACRCNPEIFKTGSIDENKVITVQRYVNEWEKAGSKAGYLNNKIVNTKLLETYTYIIDETNHFKKQDPTLQPSVQVTE